MESPPDDKNKPQPIARSLEETAILLERARIGDPAALDALIVTSYRHLRRYLHGRLPLGARGLLETQDLVQDVVMASLAKLDTFESRHPGAFLAHLRTIGIHRIVDEHRRVRRRPGTTELDEQLAGSAPSPLAIAIGRQGMERYEAAMARLSATERAAIVYRFELQYELKDVAELLGKPNANAARAAVNRAVARLLEYMDGQR
jgi:RNA polymerase sigma-70 factor (ECF subfamily)